MDEFCPHCSDKTYDVLWQYEIVEDGNRMRLMMVRERPQHYSRKHGPQQWVYDKERSAVPSTQAYADYVKEDGTRVLLGEIRCEGETCRVSHMPIIPYGTKHIHKVHEKEQSAIPVSIDKERK